MLPLRCHFDMNLWIMASDYTWWMHWVRTDMPSETEFQQHMTLGSFTSTFLIQGSRPSFWALRLRPQFRRRRFRCSAGHRWGCCAASAEWHWGSFFWAWCCAACDTWPLWTFLWSASTWGCRGWGWLLSWDRKTLPRWCAHTRRFPCGCQSIH